MENSRIFILNFLLLCNFINISSARVLSTCNDEVYKELGIAKNSDIFCEMIDLEIINRNELAINRHSQGSMTLSLTETEGALINKNTPILSHHEFTKGNVNWCHFSEGVKKVGEFSMLHNYQSQAAFVLFGNKTNGFVEGVMGHDKIRYLPMMRQYVLMRAKNNSITTFDKKSQIRTSNSTMYYKILIYLDHSYVEGKTQVQTMRSVLVYWNIVDMYYRQYFDQLKSQLNIAGIIFPDKSSPHLNTTVDRDLSTILPLNMAVYLSGESASIPTNIYDAVITMTKLPVCISVDDYNQCSDKTYLTNAKIRLRECNCAYEIVNDFTGVIQCSTTTLDDYIGTAFYVRNGFLVNIDDCVENFTANKREKLCNYPKTLENTFVSTTNVCPSEVSSTSSEFISSTTPDFIVRAGPPDTARISKI